MVETEQTELENTQPAPRGENTSPGEAGDATTRPPEASAPAATGAPAAPLLPPVPDRVILTDFQKHTLAELYDLGASLNLRVGGSRSKHQLVFEILSYFGRRGSLIQMEGIVEITREGFGLIRNPAFNFAPQPDDVFMSPSQVRRYMLRPAQLIKVMARAPREKEKFISVESVVSIEGMDPEHWISNQPQHFDKLTALFPVERILLENSKTKSVGPRVVDLIAPLGKGQRGLICAPPRGGKTILLKDIAQSIHTNHKEIELLVLLLDERPEEVTDFRETVACQVYSSTFDETPARHQQVAELVLERARRLVELGKDVVVLLDSLTRLTRGYNNYLQSKAPLGSGGINPQALQKARKFFGSARKVEEGGSLTLLATALIETESKMDEVIFEEFKGTGNMEIHLDRELVERRIFPAIHIQKSATRKDDLLYHPDEFRRIAALRKHMSQLPAGEAMEILIRHVKATASNAELLIRGLNH